MRNIALAASALLVLGYVVVGSTSCGGDDNATGGGGGGGGIGLPDGSLDGIASEGSTAGGSAGTGGHGGHGGKGGHGGSVTVEDGGGDVIISGGDAGDAAYGQLTPSKAGRRHGIALASGDSKSIPLTWNDASGLAPPADMWIESNGKPVMQVSSVNGHPFVRAGLDVAPLEAGVKYQIVLARTGNTVNATLVHDLSPEGNVVLRTQVPVTDKRLADNASVADVVLPATFWRSSVVTALP